MNIHPWVIDGPRGQHWPSLWHSWRRGRHKDREKESEKHRAWVLWEHCGGCGWGVCKRLRAHACSGQGSRSKGGLIDLQTCHHTEVKFRCGFWKWPRTPEKLEWNAYKNFVPSSSSGLPSDSSVQKSVQKNVQKSVQKIRPKNPSKKSIQKIRPNICVIL